MFKNFVKLRTTLSSPLASTEPTLFIRDQQRLFGEILRRWGNLHQFILKKKRTPPSLPPNVPLKKEQVHSRLVAIHLNSLWNEDVITRQQHASAVVKCHAPGPSSVKQIKGGICLYCESKSPPPLTADTSHVDEEEDV